MSEPKRKDGESLWGTMEWEGSAEEPLTSKVVGTRLPGKLVQRMKKLAEANGVTPHALRVLLFKEALALAEQGIIQIATEETVETKVTRTAVTRFPDE